MFRTIVASFTLLLLVPIAGADVLVLKRGKKLVGISTSIDKVEINAGNVELFLEKSKGIIAREGYDGIDFKKSIRTKKFTTYPWALIEKSFYSTEPDALLDGYDQMQLGAYAQAITAFNEVLNNPDERNVFRFDAYYRIGICYLQAGNQKTAIAHLAKWPGQSSVYTPEVKRLLAEIYTSRKQYITARDQYDQIAGLPGVPPNWKFRAKLGNVKVDIAERKFKVAEAAAKRIAAETGGSDQLTDAHSLALILQAESILKSGDDVRLPDAEATLRKAATLKGVSATNRANLFATLGDVLYKQGNLEAARFPYMRVVLMYSAEAGYVAHSLQNAGQCFLDMSGRELDKDMAKSDEYLRHAMKLLAQCAARHRGSVPGRAAAKAYRANKKRYDALKEDK